MNRAAAHRADEGTDQDSDHGGIHSAQHGLNPWPLAEHVPEGQDGDDGEKTRKKIATSQRARKGDRMQGGLDHRPQIRGKGEQGTGQSLRRAVSGEKARLIDPAARDHRVFQQWKHHVAPAEDERSGAIEGAENRQTLRQESLR